MNDRTTITQRSPIRTSRATLTLCVVGYAVLAGCTLMGGVWWGFELLTHFLVQYIVAGMGLLAWTLWRRSWVFAGIVACGLMLHIGRVAPLYFGGTPESDGIPVRVMGLNVYTDNRNIDAVVSAIREAGADIVVLMETDRRWLNGLEPLLDRYPHTAVQARSDNFGIALLSKHAIVESELFDLGDGIPGVYARCRLGDGPQGSTEINIFGVHTVPPRGAVLSRLRNDQLATLAERVRNVDGRVIVLGDLNCTSWSPYFSKLLSETGLHDSRQGYGVQPTWPAGKLLMHIPIDHCLASAEIAVTNRAVGDAVGSDHLPIVVDCVVHED